MSVMTIAITGEFLAATHMRDLLCDRGLHPHPVQPDMQVTHTGGEMGYSITVPAGEAARAREALAEAGLGKWLL
jgi:hypothetical protein